MNHALSREYRFFSLLKFALPTTVMMIFLSLYTIVDGIFVSRLVGTDALSAVNIVYPFLNLVLAAGIMLATGGSAVVARQLGEGKTAQARQNFTLITAAGVAVGIVIAVLGHAFLDPLCRMLGADEALMASSRSYLGTLLLFAPASILQLLFQSFFVTAGAPGLGLGLTVAAGCVNAALDYLFMAPMGLGVTGAALATGIGYMVPAVYGLGYFLFNRRTLRFSRPHWRGSVLAESCFNGSSEMVSNLSNAIVTLLFNLMMMRLLGSDGVAAITIVLYAQFLMSALYLGFSMGVAPVVSYNYGAENWPQLRRLLRICLGFIGGASVLVTVCSFLLGPPVVAVFSPPGSAVYDIARHGFLLFSINFLFAGFGIFASSFFTALGNGKVSAFLSFLRTLGLLVAALLILPRVMRVDGLWLAVPVAEFGAALVSAWVLYRCRARYHYA